MKAIFIIILMLSHGAFAIEDTVYRISEEAAGHRVFFKESSDVYHLRKDIKDHETILKTLKRSLSDNQKIKFDIDDKNLEITDVLCK